MEKDQFLKKGNNWGRKVVRHGEHNIKLRKGMDMAKKERVPRGGNSRRERCRYYWGKLLLEKAIFKNKKKKGGEERKRRKYALKGESNPCQKGECLLENQEGFFAIVRREVFTFDCGGD